MKAVLGVLTACIGLAIAAGPPPAMLSSALRDARLRAAAMRSTQSIGGNMAIQPAANPPQGNTAALMAARNSASSKRRREELAAAERRKKWKEVADSWKLLPSFPNPIAAQPVSVDPTLPREDVEKHFNAAEIVPPPRYVVPMAGEKYITTSLPDFSTREGKVRVGCALSATSRGMTISSIEELPLIKTLIPTFAVLLQEANDFVITPYVAFDTVDPLLGTRTGRDHVTKLWQERLPMSPAIVWVECDYTGKPAWNQNDAAMAAYEAGDDFIFRVNDDTKFATNSQGPVLKQLMTALLKMEPPALGISGPFCGMGNLDILTHEFTHRSHVDRFGFYYPRAFSTWYADEWISNIYAPLHTRINFHVKVVHTSETRYDVDAESKKQLATLEREARRKLRAWQPHVLLAANGGESQFVTPLAAKIWHDFGWNPHTVIGGTVMQSSARVLKELGLPLCGFRFTDVEGKAERQSGFCWPGQVAPHESHPHGTLGSFGLWLHEHGAHPLTSDAPDLSPVTLEGPGIALIMRMLLVGTMDLDDDEYVVSLDGLVLPTSDHYWPFMPGFQVANFSTIAYLHRVNVVSSKPSTWLGVGGYMRAWRAAFKVQRSQHPNSALASMIQHFVDNHPGSQWAGAIKGSSLEKTVWSNDDAAHLVDEMWGFAIPKRLPDQYSKPKPKNTRYKPAVRSLSTSDEPLSVMIVTLNGRARPGMFDLSEAGFSRAQKTLNLHRSRYVGVQVPGNIVRQWDLFRRLLGKTSDFELTRSAIEKYRVAFMHELEGNSNQGPPN